MTPIFVDTRAWFARFVPSDPDHPAARDWFERNTHPLITTDYVVDARYLGDTPGHIGRGGGLGPVQPDVSLGSPVNRGDERVGKVTRLTWDHSNESLEVKSSPAGPSGPERPVPRLPADSRGGRGLGSARVFRLQR